MRKERPILFSGEMVRAILDGRKTMTRRVVPERVLEKYYNYDDWCNSVMPHDIPCTRDYEHKFFTDCCPYGAPGDRLWVRETWRVGAWNEDDATIAVDYKADGYFRKEWIRVPDEEKFNDLWIQSTEDAARVFGRQEVYKWNPGDSPCRWRPSIFMPRWASRITLEIVSVKVERLQKITEEDAKKEGVSEYRPKLTAYQIRQRGGITSSESRREDFMRLWDSINGKTYPWESNPWVWAVEFKRVD